MEADNLKKTKKTGDFERLLKDYKKEINVLKDEQDRLIIRTKLEDQIED